MRLITCFRSYLVYMLYRYISGDSLNPDSFGSTAAPEVAIRQVGESVVEVWDIKQGQVMYCVNSSPLLLRCFDPKKSIYLYEPEGSSKEPNFGGLMIPTVCTSPPDASTFKQFVKNGAVKLYMPTWTLPELQAVRTFITDHSPGRMPLTEDDIAVRFHEFGGIFRHVFAPNSDYIKGEQERGIEDLFIGDDDEGPRHESNHVAQYRVATDGPRSFREARVDVVGDGVREAVEACISALDLRDKIRLLQENDERPFFMRFVCPCIYEDVIALQFLRGVRWQKKKFTDSDFSGFDLKLTKIVKGNPPMYADMEAGVLYKSFNNDYPAVEMMYKTEEGLVYGLHVTRSYATRVIKPHAVDQWLDAIGLKDEKEKVRIAVIPEPSFATLVESEYEGDMSGYPQLEVWKVPADYSQEL